MLTQTWVYLASSSVAADKARDASMRAVWAAVDGDAVESARWLILACAHDLRADAHVLMAILSGWEPYEGRLLSC